MQARRASTTILDIHGLKFSKACESACRTLQQTSDVPADTYLVQLIRIQQLADSIRSILYSGLLDAEPCSVFEVASAISSLEVSIDHLGMSLDRSLPQQRKWALLEHILPRIDYGLCNIIPNTFPIEILAISYHSLQVYLYQISLDDRVFPPPNVSFPLVEDSHQYLTTCTPPRGHDQWNTFILALFSAATKAVDHFSGLADPLILSLPYPVWTQMGHAILVLSRVVAISHHVGDPTFFFDSVLCFQTALERLRIRVESVISHGKESKGQKCLPEIFEAIPKRLTDICSAVETGMFLPSVGRMDSVSYSGAELHPV